MDREGRPPAPSYTARRQRLQKHLADRGLSGAILTDTSTISYLFQFLSIVHSPAHPPAVIAVLPAHSEAVLLVPANEEPLTHGLPERPLVLSYTDAVVRDRLLAETVGQMGSGHALGVERHRLPTPLWDALEVVLDGRRIEDISVATTRMRATKDDWELAQLEQAAHLARHALRTGLDSLATARSELMVKTLMEYEAASKAARAADGAIVQLQCNALCRPTLAGLHDLARATAIPPRGIAFLLATVRVNGYWADAARTAFIGPADADSLAAEEVVTAALQSGLTQAWPGRTVRHIVSAINGVIDQTRFAGRRRFSIIRGLGLEASEYPQQLDADAVLEPGTAFCLQCYVATPASCVGRSDTVVVTEAGHRCITAIG